MEWPICRDYTYTHRMCDILISFSVLCSAQSVAWHPTKWNVKWNKMQNTTETCHRELNTEKTMKPQKYFHVLLIFMSIFCNVSVLITESSGYSFILVFFHPGVFWTETSAQIMRMYWTYQRVFCTFYVSFALQMQSFFISFFRCVIR